MFTKWETYRIKLKVMIPQNFKSTMLAYVLSLFSRSIHVSLNIMTNVIIVSETTLLNFDFLFMTFQLSTIQTTDV